MSSFQVGSAPPRQVICHAVVSVGSWPDAVQENVLLSMRTKSAGQCLRYRAMRLRISLMGYSEFSKQWDRFQPSSELQHKNVLVPEVSLTDQSRSLALRGSLLGKLIHSYDRVGSPPPTSPAAAHSGPGALAQVRGQRSSRPLAAAAVDAAWVGRWQRALLRRSMLIG